MFDRFDRVDESNQTNDYLRIDDGVDESKKSFHQEMSFAEQNPNPTKKPVLRSKTLMHQPRNRVDESDRNPSTSDIPIRSSGQRDQELGSTCLPRTNEGGAQQVFYPRSEITVKHPRIRE